LKILQIVGGRGGEGRGGREGGREGGWIIVIPMPEAINFVDGRRQKCSHRDDDDDDDDFVDFCPF
jgi:hypothetical protein